MFMKLSRDEVLMARHMHKDVLATICPGADQGRGKIGQGGGFPSFNKFLFQTGRLQQQTEFIAMI